MNRWQKMAWFTLIVFGVGAILSGIAVTVLSLKLGFPKAYAGFAFMGIFGLSGLSPVIFRKKPGEVELDERDRMIQRRASWVGFGASYGFFGLVCMTTWFVIGPKGSISVNVLPQIFIGGMITMFFVHSVAILIQYGWRGKDGAQ